jgi:glucose/arabinose dehydrogenase
MRVSAMTGVTALATRAGDPALYATRQGGQVRAIGPGRAATRTVVDLTSRVSQDGGERGLLGLVFSPDGTHLYVDYTDIRGDTQVDELAMRGAVADLSTRRTVLTVTQPQPNHNGGQLAFGPDGYLYIGLGDGGAEGDVGPGHAPGGNGQSLATLLGKILRIDPRPSADAPYTVPSDNPFVGRFDARPEIWAYGLRNPWRFSFDGPTGDLWIADVGQDAWEEIDHAPARAGRDAGKGQNFGWNRLEGTHDYRGGTTPGLAPPVYEISHTTGACAVIGGFVYRGAQIPGLQGRYVFTDACDGTIRTLAPDTNGATNGATHAVTMSATGLHTSQASSFGRDDAGRLYVASLDTGVFRIDRAAG